MSFPQEDIFHFEGGVMPPDVSQDDIFDAIGKPAAARSASLSFYSQYTLVAESLHLG